MKQMGISEVTGIDTPASLLKEHNTCPKLTSPNLIFSTE